MPFVLRWSRPRTVYAANAYPFVAEACVNPAAIKMIERGGGDVTIQTIASLPGIACVWY